MEHNKSSFKKKVYIINASIKKHKKTQTTCKYLQLKEIRKTRTKLVEGKE
jgi:hypothetical protein